MEWIDAAFNLFERNAVIIAGLEFVVLLACWPGKMIFDWLRHRRTRTHASRLHQQLERQLQEAEKAAAARHHELVDLRSVLNRVEMKPLGDSARVGQLPDGTNIVEAASGQIRLSLPIRMEGVETVAVGGRAVATLRDKDGNIKDRRIADD